MWQKNLNNFSLRRTEARRQARFNAILWIVGGVVLVGVMTVVNYQVGVMVNG
jgi:hypothetical protein